MLGQSHSRIIKGRRDRPVVKSSSREEFPAVALRVVQYAIFETSHIERGSFRLKRGYAGRFTSLYEFTIENMGMCYTINGAMFMHPHLLNYIRGPVLLCPSAAALEAGDWEGVIPALLVDCLVKPGYASVVIEGPRRINL